MNISLISILFIIAIVVTLLFVKRWRPQSRLLVYGIAFLVISAITFVAVLLPMIIFKYTNDLYKSEEYDAKIVDFVYETREIATDNSTSREEVTVKIPVVQWVTLQGDTITKKLSYYNDVYSYNSKEMNCRMRYNPYTGNVFIASRESYIWLALMVFLATLSDFVLLGLLLYVAGSNMELYNNIGNFILFYITIPILIIGFATMFLAFAFQRVNMPFFAKMFCIVIGVLLYLSFIGYIKTLLKPKKKRRHTRPPFLDIRK